MTPGKLLKIDIQFLASWCISLLLLDSKMFGLVHSNAFSDIGRCRTMWTVSNSGRTWPIMWGGRWNRFTFCFRSEVISTSGFVADIVGFRCRPMPGNVDSAI